MKVWMYVLFSYVGFPLPYWWPAILCWVCRGLGLVLFFCVELKVMEVTKMQGWFTWWTCSNMYCQLGDSIYLPPFIPDYQSQQNQWIDRSNNFLLSQVSTQRRFTSFPYFDLPFAVSWAQDFSVCIRAVTWYTVETRTYTLPEFNIAPEKLPFE